MVQVMRLSALDNITSCLVVPSGGWWTRLLLLGRGLQGGHYLVCLKFDDSSMFKLILLSWC